MALLSLSLSLSLSFHPFQQVQLSGCVEEWMSALLSSSKTTIQQLLLQAMDSDLPSLEELVLCHVTQVACVALHHHWTKDCEQVSEQQMWQSSAFGKELYCTSSLATPQKQQQQQQ